MKQTAKRTTTVTVDLGELKAPWQAWCQVHGVAPSHALRNALGRLWTGKGLRFLRLGCASRRSLNEPLLAWK